MAAPQSLRLHRSQIFSGYGYSTDYSGRGLLPVGCKLPAKSISAESTCPVWTRY